LPLALCTLASTLAIPRISQAAPFSQRKIIIEVNSTAGDGGIQISVDGTGWNRLEVFDPNGRRVVDVGGSNSVGVTGITELFFESAEPSFADLPLDQLLVRFPAGNYTFQGTTVDGGRLSGKAALKHNIPAGPSIVSPANGSALDPAAPLAIDWDPVTSPFPGTTLPVTITGYQVIVERVRPQPLQSFSVFLPAAITEVTVPPQFLEANADYAFEVLAIEASGNQTITEGNFTTTSGGSKASGSADARPASGAALGEPRGAFLQNSPNPFNPTTAFAFRIPTEGVTTLKVFDVSGRLVRTLVEDRLAAGPHSAAWNGTDDRGRAVASGSYVAVLGAPGVSESRRVVLTR
jgi:hypothetical protein